MPALLFQRLTGVPWEEFRVAWRRYPAEHGRRLLILTAVLWFSMAILSILASRHSQALIDLDGSGSFFPSASELAWRDGGSSLLYLLAVLIPLVPFLVPAGPRDAVERQGPASELIARLCALAISVPLIIIFCRYEVAVLSTQWYMNGSDRTDILLQKVPATALFMFVAIFLLQRYLQPGRRPGLAWATAYIVWAVSFLMLKNLTWDTHYSVHQDLYWNGFAEFSLLLATLSAPLMVIYARRYSLAVYVWCCLNPLFFAFVYGHFSNSFTLWRTPYPLQESAFAPLVERIGWLVVGINEMSIGRFTAMFQ